jgi:pSer/pThr/pTyr-binding forkhead associated (FHA) protein
MTRAYRQRSGVRKTLITMLPVLGVNRLGRADPIQSRLQCRRASGYDRRVAGELNLEIVEGPGAGREIIIDRPLVIGRADDADVVLEDGEVSRHHVRITPAGDGGATVEDLDSTNGTFVNQNELIGPAHLGPGDDLLLGVTVLRMRTAEEIRSGLSGVIQVPPGLAMAPRTPTYVNPEVARADSLREETEASGIPQLERYLDVRVRRRAQLAPLAVTMLVAIALILYFSLR